MSKELDVAKEVLVLDENEQILQAFKALFFPTSQSIKQVARILPGKEFKVEEKRKDVNVQDGMIALTNKRLFWLQERGAFKKTYHPVISLYLTDISSMSMQGTLAKRINIASSQGEFQFRFGGMEKFIESISNIKKELRAKPAPQAAATSQLEDLKKLKELLDMEAITKEEYEQKKKKILERV